jgi:hypothetical protein
MKAEGALLRSTRFWSLVGEYGDALSPTGAGTTEGQRLDDAFGKKPQSTKDRGMLTQQPVPIPRMWLERYHPKAFTFGEVPNSLARHGRREAGLVWYRRSLPEQHSIAENV